MEKLKIIYQSGMSRPVRNPQTCKILRLIARNRTAANCSECIKPNIHTPLEYNNNTKPKTNHQLYT